MAGFWGSHLGVIDLTLQQQPGIGWRITDFPSRAEPVDADDPAPLPGDPGAAAASAVAAQVMRVHRGTLRQQRRRIGVTRQPLHSYFALIGEDPGLRLIAAAQRWHVRRALGRQGRDLPILAAAAPFRAGGLAGPHYFTDVPAGPLNLRALSDLYLYPNRICAVTITGAQLAEWLERAASIFARVTPGLADQPLLDADFPTYNFDVIDGVSWRVDLTRPAGFTPAGQPSGATAPRITHLCRHGEPVHPDARFVLATNSYRLSSCRVFSALGSRLPVILRDDTLTRDVLRRYVARRGCIDLPPARTWRFADCPDTSVMVETGPGALRHLGSVADLRIEPAGTSASGFSRLRLHL